MHLYITVYGYSYTIDQVVLYVKLQTEKRSNCIDWLLSIDASANIQRNYLQAIKALCEFIYKCLMNIF